MLERIDVDALVAFLDARWAHEAVIAQRATPGPWSHDPRKEWHTNLTARTLAEFGFPVKGGEEFVKADALGPRYCVAVTGPSDDVDSMDDARHIAQWHPDRVLIELQVKRRLLQGLVNTGWLGRYDLLKLFALPYRDHPDYRQEWTP